MRFKDRELTGNGGCRSLIEAEDTCGINEVAGQSANRVENPSCPAPLSNAVPETKNSSAIDSR